MYDKDFSNSDLSSRPKVGVISFTDPRSKNTSMSGELEEFNARKHVELLNYLKKQGFIVIDPMSVLAEKENFGVGSPRDIAQCVQVLKQEGAEALIMGCWVWTDSMLPVYLQREMNLPTLLYAESDRVPRQGAHS